MEFIQPSNLLALHSNYSILMNNGIALRQRQGYSKVDFNCMNYLSVFYYIVNLQMCFSYGETTVQIYQMIVAISYKQYIRLIIHQTNKYSFISMFSNVQ